MKKNMFFVIFGLLLNMGVQAADVSDIKTEGECPSTALKQNNHFLCFCDCSEAQRKLRKALLNSNTSTEDKERIAKYAVQEVRSDLLSSALEAGVSPKSEWLNHSNCDPECVKLLAKHAKDKQTFLDTLGGQHYETPLQIAMNQLKWDKVMALIISGANPIARTSLLERTPAHYIVSQLPFRHDKGKSELNVLRALQEKTEQRHVEQYGEQGLFQKFCNPVPNIMHIGDVYGHTPEGEIYAYRNHYCRYYRSEEGNQERCDDFNHIIKQLKERGML